MDTDLDAELARLEEEIEEDAKATHASGQEQNGDTTTNSAPRQDPVSRTTRGGNSPPQVPAGPQLPPSMLRDRAQGSGSHTVQARDASSVTPARFDEIKAGASSRGTHPGTGRRSFGPLESGVTLGVSNLHARNLHSQPFQDARLYPQAGQLYTPATRHGQAGQVWNGSQWVWAAPSQAPSVPEGALTGQAQTAVDAGQAGKDGAWGEPHAPSADNSTSSGKRPRTGQRRSAAGSVWIDATMEEWPEDDFRIFVGDLAPDATGDQLSDAFKKYPSFNMARVVMDKRTGECRGYGFVSFAKGQDMVAALREMNGKYIGSRPVKLKKSNWQKRELTSEKARELKVLKSSGVIGKSRKRR